MSRSEGKKGDKVVIRYAEVLDENGELYVANLRRAECRDEMILSGGEDTFDPKFTFHGFRYAEIRGYSGAFKAVRHAVFAPFDDNADAGDRLQRKF